MKKNYLLVCFVAIFCSMIIVGCGNNTVFGSRAAGTYVLDGTQEDENPTKFTCTKNGEFKFKIPSQVNSIPELDISNIDISNIGIPNVNKPTDMEANLILEDDGNVNGSFAGNKTENNIGTWTLKDRILAIKIKNVGFELKFYKIS